MRIQLTSQPNMRILNGDGGAFFKSKIYRIPKSKSIYEAMKRWEDKTFKYYITGFKVEQVIREGDEITLKWHEVHSKHDEYGNVLEWTGRGATHHTLIYLGVDGRVNTIVY